MAEHPERFYWDSCVFLSYIEGHRDRVGDIEVLLERADQGKLEILTSTATIAEVAYAKQEKDGRILRPDMEERISRLWSPPSPVLLVEFHQGIAHGARRLMREAMTRGMSLKPFDAIHLSSAQALAVTALQSYDEGLAGYAELAGLKIGRPFVEQMPLLLTAPPEEDGK